MLNQTAQHWDGEINHGDHGEIDGLDFPLSPVFPVVETVRIFLGPDLDAGC